MIGTESPSNTLRILLVEDTADDAELIALALRRTGLAFSLVRVENEAQLQSQLRLETPDIVLCDYHLPGFNCHRVLDIIRELPVPPPVVVVSRHVSATEEAETIRRGASGCVRKDRLGELAAAIMSSLRDRRGPQAQTPAPSAR
jgi:CheY-like chemotaxis protein